MLTTLRTKHLVSHKWERAARLRDVRAGLIPREEVCDADFLLRAAARYHGVPASGPCPVCGAELKVTYWIYGDALGRRAGSARPPGELADIAREVTSRGEEFTVHEVEVCPHCRWNHLRETATAY